MWFAISDIKALLSSVNYRERESARNRNSLAINHPDSIHVGIRPMPRGKRSAKFELGEMSYIIDWLYLG